MDITKLTDQTVQSLIEIGRASAGPQTVQYTTGNPPMPYVISNGKVTMLTEMAFNEYSAAPPRVKAIVKVTDAASFIEYYSLFHDENSRVFADEVQLSVIGVLDYHGAGGNSPRWGHHKVALTLKPSDEYAVWTGRNNQQFSQQSFAEFLEQHAGDIVAPGAAAIREIAEDLEATMEVEFASVQKQAGGKVQFKYMETTKTTVSGGKSVIVPDQFTISIPVFLGTPRIEIHALLRYRIKEGKLTFFYTLVKPDDAMRRAFASERNAIRDSLKVNIINGTL